MKSTNANESNECPKINSCSDQTWNQVLVRLYLSTCIPSKWSEPFFFSWAEALFPVLDLRFPLISGVWLFLFKSHQSLKKKEINLWNWYLFRVCSTQISNWNLYSRCWWSWRIVGIQLFLINSLVVCSINQNRLTLWSLWTFLFGILRENEKNHSILLAFVMLAVS